MKEMIEKIDRLLANVIVMGDSVLLLADARTMLGQVHRIIGETEERADG